MNAEQLNAIKEREAKATPGPWEAKGLQSLSYARVEKRETKYESKIIVEALNNDNIEFIAHAREDVPALVAEVKRLNTVKHRLNSDVELYRKQYEGAQIQLSESEAENERLRKALEYFADDENYFYGIAGECNVLDNGRKLAREALKCSED